MTERQTLALETYVQRSFNYYTNMVDAHGVPYFNIFWTDPAEAAHDWPDSGDVTARQLQAVIMARHATGVACFYGEDGPGKLYRREHWVNGAAPKLSPIHLDDGALDFWHVK